MVSLRVLVRRTRGHRFAAFATVVAAMLVSAGSVKAASPTDVRALRVPLTTLDSPQAVRSLVSTAAADGFDTLLVDATPGRRPSGFDAFADVVSSAHEVGLRVLAWIDAGLVAAAGTLPAPREHVVYEHPEWLMVPHDLAAELLPIDLRSPDYLGRLARWTRANTSRVEGLYLSPLHADARTRVASAIGAFAATYAVDGVHLDTLQYPGLDFDYSRAAMEVFKSDVRATLTAADRVRMDGIEAIDPFGYADEFPDEWRRFRQSQLTALVARIRSTLRAVRPAATLSASVVPDAAIASVERMQDWRTWLDLGFLDAVSPAGDMRDPATAAELAQRIRQMAGSHPVWMPVSQRQIDGSR